MRITATLLAAFLALATSPAFAQEYKVGEIKIETPWARATPKGASVGAGYMKITNTGNAPDRLVGGSVDFAKRLELHSMTMDNGVMKMREVQGGLEIKPGETVELAPGGLHLMFVDLKQPLAQGQHVKATLNFVKAGSVEVEYTVEAAGARAGESKKMGH